MKKSKIRYSIILVGVLISTNSFGNDNIRNATTETIYIPSLNITMSDRSVDTTNMANQNNANASCDDLSIAGFNGWRLPTGRELGSMINDPNIKGITQNYHTSAYYWSSDNLGVGFTMKYDGTMNNSASLTDSEVHYRCVIDGKLNNSPTIESVTSVQTLQDSSTITPFSDVNVSDKNGDDINVTITLDSASKGTLSGTGLMDKNDGNYTISIGTPTDVNTTLHSIVFTPTANRIVYEKIEYTKIKLTVTDANDDSTIDYNTTIATVGANSAIQPDVTSANFSIIAKTDQTQLTEIISSAITIGIMNIDTNISIVNGYYRIDGGDWNNSNTTLSESNITSAVNYKIEVKNTTSANWYDTNTTTLTIGGVSREFNTTTAKASLSELTANKWQLKSIGNGKLADLSTSSVASSELNSSIWVYRDNLWVENPTSVTPKEGLWIKPTGTTINFKAEANTTNNLTDANAQYAYYKDLNKSAWNLVGVPNQLEWSNVIRNSNITPDTCPMYSGFYFYDVENVTWNTTTNIPANSGAFIKHICP